MSWKYIEITFNDQNQKGSKSTIERLYRFVESSAGQEAKVKLTQGLLSLIIEQKPENLSIKGSIIGDTPIISRYSEVIISASAEGQRYIINLGACGQKKEKSEKKNSELKVHISCEIPITTAHLGRLFPSYLRTFEDSLGHYRQKELDPLLRELHLNSLFELQREYGWSAKQVLSALDKRVSLEQLTKELLEHKGKK
ncbi:MAG: hypothetical protein Q7K45_06185 [Nanoarchaeota archaeon]|nr:hypothetical protein [Nanoarchaeota archaeon]